MRQTRPGMLWPQVTGIFGSSMEVMVSVCGENPAVGNTFHCGDAYATVVSVDELGGPVDVPFELEPTEANDIRRCAQAAQRHVPLPSLLFISTLFLACVAGTRLVNSPEGSSGDHQCS